MLHICFPELATFPASQNNDVGFTPQLLNSSISYSPEGIIQLKTAQAQDAWLQWS